MSNTNTQTVPAIVLRRTYKAPRQRVFDAWIKPEIAARFFGPGDVKAEIAKMEARTGGEYRIVMHGTPAGDMTVWGTYREVRAPERIQFTWRWEEDDAKDEYDSLVTLDFKEVAPGETELTLTHEGIRTEESRGNHTHGWAQIVDQLTGVVR